MNRVPRTGERVWGYSANGGRSEQGRIEFRSSGKLRTTWGWGTWRLLPEEEVRPSPCLPSLRGQRLGSACPVLSEVTCVRRRMILLCDDLSYR